MNLNQLIKAAVLGGALCTSRAGGLFNAVKACSFRGAA